MLLKIRFAIKCLSHRGHVAIREEDIQPSRVVDIQKTSPKCEIGQCCRSHPRFAGDIREEAAIVAVKRIRFVLERCDGVIHIAILVVVADRNTHIGLCRACDAVGNALHHPKLFELQSAKALKQRVWPEVICDEEVCLGITIGIECRYPKASPHFGS